MDQLEQLGGRAERNRGRYQCGAHYKEAAAAMSTRAYAMQVFLPALRDLGKAKATPEISSKEASVEKRKPDAEKKPQPSTVDASTSAASTEGTKDIEFLHRLELNIKHQRFASYYEQLKLWNENYDRLLYEIEITLDRPALSQVNESAGDISLALFHQIDCSKSLTEELERLQLNPNSLKLRFAAINQCFMDAHALI
jgi:hypothetical protein